MTTQDWAADTPISLPEPIDIDGPHVPMHGFVFTENGLFHHLSEADHEIVRQPTFQPPAIPSETVYDDGR